MQGLDAQLAELEVVLGVGLIHLTVFDGDVAIDIAAVVAAVAHEINRLHGFDAVGLQLHDFFQLLAGAGEAPDPFTRAEIDTLLATETDRVQEINLIRFMLWSGPRVSEAMAIAEQMGHMSTAMIFKHYATWISDDGPDFVGILNKALNLG